MFGFPSREVVERLRKEYGMGAYAYSDTEGNEIEKAVHCINFMDRIAVITQSTTEIADKSFPLGQRYLKISIK